MSEANVISTHTPLAGRDEKRGTNTMHYRISTHTPLAGRDLFCASILSNLSSFLLTRPLRDVTAVFGFWMNTIFISTHTPLAGRDPNHNPYNTEAKEFLLTRPLRDVTCSVAVWTH